MKYLFECSACLNREDKEIPMDKYDSEKENQKCSRCEGAMNRIVEFNGKIGLCSGMFGASGWNS